MELATGKTHGGLIASAVRGGKAESAAINRNVLASWKRCLEDYELDPEHRPEPIVIDRDDLKERQARCCQLTDIARSEMTNLYQQVAGSGCSILLTDNDGVVLNYVGDPMFTSTAAQTSLQTGAVWTEQAQGTNGMGTCLVEKQPLIIHQEEHFFAKNTKLTCSAAPIFNPRGELIAVLDASSESRMAQQHTMVLVNMSAQLIENRLFLCCMRDNYIVRFHSRAEFISTFGEGAIAFDSDGSIVAANRSALFQLDSGDIANVIGRNLEDLFSMRTNVAQSYAHEQASQPMPLREAHQGRRFYASFQPPTSERPKTRASGVKVAVSEDDTTSLTAIDGLGLGDTRMSRNIERAKKLLERDIPLLILGETGTGKDVFASAVHRAGSRADKPFIAVNCASLPETLIESELFGYKSGAFTGASKEGARGKIAQAHGGTLFLDEIGDMPLHLQARLLRVLEDREVIPLGGEVPTKVDIRVISATHQDIRGLVEDGSFREDLFYRLNGISLLMPPLRDREDRRALIELVLNQEAGADVKVSIEADVLQALDQFDWPGNVRQLRNVLRAMIGLSDDGILRVDDLPEEVLAGNAEGVGIVANRPSSPLDIAERDAILRELEAAHWNVTRVASKLNLSRNTLYRKMKRFGIKPPR